MPLGFKAIDNKGTRFVGTAKEQVELSAIFIHNAARCVLLLATQIMIQGAIIAPSLTAARKVADLHGRFTIHTPALYRTG
jgi:hypothetical protein